MTFKEMLKYLLAEAICNNHISGCKGGCPFNESSDCGDKNYDDKINEAINLAKIYLKDVEDVGNDGVNNWR